MGEPHTRLDDLGQENISPGSTARLEYALDQLAEAEELNEGFDWKTKLWPHVTIEELLGALIEADWLLESYREQTVEGYEPDPRFPRER